MTGSAGVPGEESPAYRRMMVALLFFSGLFNFTDRNLFPVLAQAIKQDLGLSDTQIGLLGGPSFALVYTLAGLPIARLADRRSRVAILAASTAVWSVFCALCGTARSFQHLLLTRAGLGIGEAGFLPASTSLVGDHYPLQRRASILAIIQLGSPASTIACALIAALIGQTWGWRAAMIAVGLPGLVIAFLLHALLREPPRGRFDAAVEGVAPLSWTATVGELIRRPGFAYVVLGAALATLCVNAIAQFYVAYFVRIHGWTLAQGGYAFGVIQCTAATIGLLAGGFGADLLARRDERWRCWLPAIGLCIACGCYIAAFRQSDGMAAAAGLMIGGIFLFTFYMQSIGMIQAMAGAHARATAVAIFSLAGTLLGVGVGPVAAGFASDLFAARAFGSADFASRCPGGRAIAGASAALRDACASASAEGLQAALLLAPLVLLPAAVLYLLAARVLPRSTVSTAAT